MVAKLVTNPLPLTRLIYGQLLDVIPELDIPADAVNPAVNLRWLGGVTWTPRPCRPISVGSVDACNGADFTNPDYACLAPIEQLAFSLYDAFNGPLSEFSSEVDDELLMRLDVQESWAFARELLGGAASGGMSLSGSATEPTGVPFGSDAQAVYNAFAAVESELCERLYGATGIIHVPPAMMPIALRWAGVTRTGNRYYSALGHTVIADAGYVNPPAPTDVDAPDAGSAEDWIYGSGPVAYKYKSPEPLGELINQFGSIAHNLFERWMTAYGLLVFEPCAVTAVLASYDGGGF